MIAELIFAIVTDTVVVCVAILVSGSELNGTSASCILPVLVGIKAPIGIVGVGTVALFANVANTVFILVIVSVIGLILRSYFALTSVFVPVRCCIVRPFGVISVSAHRVITHVAGTVVVAVGVISLLGIGDRATADNFFVVLGFCFGIIVRVSVCADLEFTVIVVTDSVEVIVNVVALYSFAASVTNKVLFFLVYVLGTLNLSTASVTDTVSRISIYVHGTSLCCVVLDAGNRYCASAECKTTNDYD